MWPFPSSQQLKRKREKGSGSGSSDGEEQHQKQQQLNDAKRARLEDIEKPQLFNMWLNMKKERRHDRKLQDLVDAFVLPEDLYQHFKEFVPPAGADADAVFMRRLQYERECAERALNRCKVRSWLLRRSSLNRRSIVLRVPFELGLGDRLQFGAAAPNDAQRPTFYAFSYTNGGTIESCRISSMRSSCLKISTSTSRSSCLRPVPTPTPSSCDASSTNANALSEPSTDARCARGCCVDRRSTEGPSCCACRSSSAWAIGSSSAPPPPPTTRNVPPSTPSPTRRRPARAASLTCSS